MSYTTPVFDRTVLDIIAKNSKAHLNVADWDRIDDNTAEVVYLILFTFTAIVSQVTVTTMTKASIPTVDDVNDLAGNIEAVRTWIITNHPTSAAATDPDFTDVKDDYTSGTNLTYTGYNYPFEVVNHWEKVIDIAYQWLDGLVLVPAITGFTEAGAGFTEQSMFEG